MGFLKVKHWDGGGWGKLVRWDGNSGAHGVTRPATPWVGDWCDGDGGVWFQSVKSDITGVFDNFSLGMTNDECQMTKE